MASPVAFLSVLPRLRRFRSAMQAVFTVWHLSRERQRAVDFPFTHARGSDNGSGVIAASSSQPLYEMRVVTTLLLPSPSLPA
jgi:hypothetical protein